MRALLDRQVRRGLAALAGGLAVASLALSVYADLDPARIETWKLPRASLFGVMAQGDANAWACGYWGTILRSVDAGKTWTQSDTPTAETLFAVSFADDKSG